MSYSSPCNAYFSLSLTAIDRDLYTQRHTQWFYFSVSNMKLQQTYIFNIVNMAKRDSLFLRGMQPCVYSMALAKESQIGWHRAGDNIAYFPSSLRSAAYAHSLYTLSFSFTCRYSNDTVYFAYGVPYTFSDLQEYLVHILSQPQNAHTLRHRTLTHSVAGNPCHLLTITTFGESSTPSSARPAVVVTARVHPGEAGASWMMKGIIDFLLSDDPDAKVSQGERTIFRQSVLTER